jgi:hypothetical protein
MGKHAEEKTSPAAGWGGGRKRNGSERVKIL